MGVVFARTDSEYPSGIETEFLATSLSSGPRVKASLRMSPRVLPPRDWTVSRREN